MPLIIRSHMLYILDNITEQSVGSFVLDMVLDCLGRSWLHKYLDTCSALRGGTVWIKYSLMKYRSPILWYPRAYSSLHCVLKELPSSREYALTSIADPRWKSVSVSLPIRYAATSRSILMCRQLITVWCQRFRGDGPHGTVLCSQTWPCLPSSNFF